MTLCNECKKRPDCTQLCKKAEKYADQDNVEQEEFNIGEPKYFKTSWPEVSERLTKRELQILRLLLAQINKNEICEVLKITKGNLFVHISNIRKKYS